MAPLRWTIRFFEMIVDYTGPFAIIFKGLPVAAMALLIFSPYIVYVWLLNIAQSVGAPFCYVLYMLWWVYLGSLIVLGGLVGYVMETKSSSWVLPKSVDYQRQKGKKQEGQEWNADKVVKEYFEVLKKQKK